MRYTTLFLIALVSALFASGGVFNPNAADRIVSGNRLAEDKRDASPSRYVYAGEWGKEGKGKGEFHLPSSVTVTPNGTVYVADPDNHRVQYFTSTGSYLGEWDIWAATERYYYFNVPQTISAGPDGRVYAVEGPHLIVSCFGETGELLDEWFVEGPSDDGPRFCYDAVVNTAGNLYVTYGYANRIQFFSSDGPFLGSWGKEGSGPGEFNSDVLGIASLPGGDFVVSDRENHRIQQFTPSGSFVRTWGSEGNRESEFEYPLGLAVGPGSRVFVADSCNNRIQYFTDTGSFLGSIGNEGDGPGQFDYPTDVALSKDGILYVVDMHNHRIQYFRPVPAEDN